MAEHRLLVVDDEPHIGKIISHICTRDPGLHADTVGDLAGARKLLAENTYAMVLLDLKLPDGSGLDFLQELRAGPQSEIPVIVLSGAGYGDVAERVSDMQADYIPKPFSPSKLIRQIHKTLDLDL